MESSKFDSENRSVSSEETLSGGFFLTQPVVIPKLERIPPQGFLTVSKCLGEFVPDDWVYWNPEDRRAERGERAKALGIEPDLLDYLKVWCTEQFKERRTLGYPNVIFDIETARALVEQVLGHRSQPLTLLGIGLPFRVSGEFFQKLKPVTRGSSEISHGVPTMLQGGMAIPEGGDSLGFDALCYEPRDGTFHSSKCYKVDNSEISHISFNAYGYCPALSEAIKLCEIHSKGSAGEIAWLPWEIRRYPLAFKST
jgi:hypothetical protein